MTTSNYNADQGGYSGAQVALVTKSGTNNFHGSAYEYHRNTYTSANDYFVKASEHEIRAAEHSAELIRNIFGGSLGGPTSRTGCICSQTFEGTRRAEAVSQTVQVPTNSMRDGIIQYLCADPSACPGGNVGNERKELYGSVGLSSSVTGAIDGDRSPAPGAQRACCGVSQYFSAPIATIPATASTTAASTLRRRFRTLRTSTSRRWTTTSRRTANTGFP